MVKGKAVAADVRVPQNREDVAEMIAEFGRVAVEVDVIETVMKDKLLEVKRDAEKEAEPHLQKAKALFAGLQLYCDANRQQLLGNSGLKTVEFPTGTVSWRHKPPKVSLSGEADDIIAAIHDAAGNAIKRGDKETSYAFLNFIRNKQEVDKESMLKNPDLARTVAGVKIGRGGEVFEIEPFGAKLAEAAQ